MPDGQPHSSSPVPSSQEQVQASQDDDARWERVAERLDAFSEAWEKHNRGTAPEPRLTDFIPQLPDDSRQILLGELIKTDLEQRWLHDCSPKKMENYVEQMPEMGPVTELPVELIYEELQARMQSGDQVSEKELRERFPQQADDLCSLLGGLAVSGNATCTYFTATSAGTRVGSDVRMVQQSFKMFNPGDRVDDFELLLLLGSGTFAQVFLARQLSMERLVALKISAQSGSEPQTLAQLDHGNIVRVFDLRDTTDPPLRLLYMEVVPGGTLRDVLPSVRMADKKQRTGQLLLNAVDQQLGTRGVAPPENSPARDWLANASWPLAVCQLGAQLAEGLAYAHDKGVLHRDVKPANVLLTPEGAPKLADFNISFNGGRADEDPADTFGGSMAYMAPEQLEACHPVLEGSPQLVREVSDIYAVGVLLWEQICGRRPFGDGDKTNGTLALLQRMVDQRRHADWPLLEKQLSADCPPSMRQVLVRCLQAEKRARYQSAGELARDLRMCLQPRCWKLLQPRNDWFSSILLRWPVLFVILLGFLPNALAGWFNYTYNKIAIIDRETDSLARHFQHVQVTINLIAFPLGIAIGAWAAYRTMRLFRRDHLDDAQRCTRRVLLFGRFVTLLSMTLWLLSGLAFPVALDWGQSVATPTAFYTHFFVSLALCGLVAAAYPYFLLTMIAVRWYLPALVRSGVIAGPAWKDLQTVRSLNRVHLYLTASVPMLAILLVVLFPVEQSTEQSWVQIVASLVGLLGFAAMLVLERIIDHDLTALETIAIGQPARKPL